MGTIHFFFFAVTTVLHNKVGYYCIGTVLQLHFQNTLKLLVVTNFNTQLFTAY